MNQGGAVSDLFIGENSSTFESGTKIVPRVELSYVPWNCSRGGAVLAPLFFSVYTNLSEMLIYLRCDVDWAISSESAEI